MAVAAAEITPSLPTWRVVRWLEAGVATLRRAPLKIVVLSLLPVAGEAVCQMIPLAGIVLSKVLTPWLSAWALLALDAKVRSGRFTLRMCAGMLMNQRRSMGALSVLGLGVFAFQVAVAIALAGPTQAWALMTGDVARLQMDRLQVAAMLASGIVPAMALAFVLPRLVLAHRGIVDALGDNLRGWRRAWRPLLAYSALTAALVAGLVWWPVVLLLLLPMGLVATFTMHRDVFGDA